MEVSNSVSAGAFKAQDEEYATTRQREVGSTKDETKEWGCGSLPSDEKAQVRVFSTRTRKDRPGGRGRNGSSELEIRLASCLLLDKIINSSGRENCRCLNSG